MTNIVRQAENILAIRVAREEIHGIVFCAVCFSDTAKCLGVLERHDLADKIAIFSADAIRDAMLAQQAKEGEA